MKKRRVVLSTVLIALLALSPLVGCSACGEMPAEDTSFSYSKGINDEGFWEGITASDIVEEFEYEGMEIPADVHEISDEEVQTQVDTLLANYSTTQEVTDRPAQDGDTLNISYVGTIDGVAFDGGATTDEGAEVTIGTTTYVGDFMEQLIGHSVGESFDVAVTFPEDYGDEELNGKDAVFAVTINTITETIVPEATDTFVTDHLSADYGWTTVKEMEKGIYEDMQQSAIQSYVQDYLANEVIVSEIPESLLVYQEGALVYYYETYAEMYGVTLDEFLTSYVGIADKETLLSESQEDIRLSAVYSLAIQAVAEWAGLNVSDEDLSNYFLEVMGESDYSAYEEEYGLPYLKQTVLSQKVLDLMIDSAVLM